MNIIQRNGNIILEGVKNFNIGQTLECGQCFRFDKIDEDEYIIVAMERILRVRQIEDNVTLYNTKIDEYNAIWKHYFDLDRDYTMIKRRLLEKDAILEEAINSKNGIRILNQEFFEMLISFIISQNKQIPHIKQIVELLSTRYGKYIVTINGKDYYSFPSVENLSKVTEEDFRECKAGFRAPYLVNACNAVWEGRITKEMLEHLKDQEVMKELTSIKGVGDKIANCVMLFGLSRSEAFPVDVWVKRVMENLYFHKDTKKEVIKEFAKEQFGEYAGFAQQYLFIYARDKKMKNVS